MIERLIDNFEDLHKIIAGYGKQNMIYRGLKSVNFALLPRIGYLVPPPSSRSREKNEKEILRLFKERALPYLDFIPENNWDWLAIGQHYGLPTRLMDWSRNPLVACYFAVEEDCDDNSVVYAYHNKYYISIEKHPEPFEFDKTGKFIPRHLTPRIAAQAGVFTIHFNPYKPFESYEIEKIIIPNKIRSYMKWTLNQYGIDRSSLFPDLDGLANHIKWLRSKNY